jgi:hypothetical protein
VGDGAQRVCAYWRANARRHCLDAVCVSLLFAQRMHAKKGKAAAPSPAAALGPGLEAAAALLPLLDEGKREKAVRLAAQAAAAPAELRAPLRAKLLKKVTRWAEAAASGAAGGPPAAVAMAPAAAAKPPKAVTPARAPQPQPGSPLTPWAVRFASVALPTLRSRASLCRRCSGFAFAAPRRRCAPRGPRRRDRPDAPR